MSAALNWDQWRQRLMGPDYPDLSGQISSALGGAHQQSLSLGNRAWDTGDSATLGLGAQPKPTSLGSFTPNGSYSAAQTIASGLGNGGRGSSYAGLKLPAGWDGSKNRYAYNLPSTFLANQTLYQTGYDPNQDKGGIDVGRGADTETYLNRVYGYMNAIARQNGYGDISQMSQEQQAGAMNYALGRVRTDAYNTDPSGAAWQRSGFAGYDKYLAGGDTPLGNPQQPKPTPQGGFDPNGATRNDPSNYTPLGGTGGYGPGPLTIGPDGTATHSSTGDSEMSGAPGYDPAGGGGGSARNNPNGVKSGTYYGGAPDILINKPQAAWAAVQRALGGDPSVHGIFDSYMQRKFAPLVAAYFQSQINGAGKSAGDINQMINDFAGAFGQGGDLYGFLGNAAQQGMAGADKLLNGADAGVAQDYLQMMLGLGGAGLGTLGQSALSTGLGDMNDAYETEALLNGGFNTSKYGDFWRKSQFANQARGLLGR